MSTIELLPQTQELLTDKILGQQDVDTTIRLLLEGEYMRRLSQYRRTNYELQDKYEMSFSEFVERRITRELNYSWEVEKDAMAWETAVGGISTFEKKLEEVRQPVTG
jgi:hypothetical protein